PRRMGPDRGANPILRPRERQRCLPVLGRCEKVAPRTAYHRPRESYAQPMTPKTFSKRFPELSSSLSPDELKALVGAFELHDAVALTSAIEAGTRLAREFRDVTRGVREKIEIGRESAVKEYDVVVIGAGPHALAYATWIKQDRPETRIALVDKRAAPGFKIGE